MRKRFEQQPLLDCVRIEDIVLEDKRKRDRLTQLFRALKEIYITPEYNEKIFSIMEEKINAGKKDTGRPGMTLWQIFVLGQVRLCYDIDYDRLWHMANYDLLLRQMLGIETIFSDSEIKIHYQTLVDNVGLLTDEILHQINNVVASLGDKVFKKKRTTGTPVLI